LNEKKKQKKKQNKKKKKKKKEKVEVKEGLCVKLNSICIFLP
jgi:hypothetical protein